MTGWLAAGEANPNFGKVAVPQRSLSRGPTKEFRSMSIASDGRAAPANQKIQVRTLARLHHMLDVEPNPAATGQRRRLPLRAAAGECGVFNLQAERTIGNVERNYVVRLHQRERAAC